jgi:2-oxoglutarate ferredoxin oxidoreductase subunit alpha
MKTLLMVELQANPAKLISVLNYNGLPITADNILEQIARNLSGSPKLKKA